MRPLADVAGREDDALRVVVAETEDRIGEVEPVVQIRRRAAGRSTASLTFSIAQSPGSTSTCASPVSTIRAARARPLYIDLDRGDPARLRHIAERHHAVLHGDEVAVAEIAGGAVVARAGRVVGIHLDEALAALAQHADRQQAHLGLQLALDVGDDRGAALGVHRGRFRVGRTPGGPERGFGVLAPEHAELGAQRCDLLAFAIGVWRAVRKLPRPKKNDAERAMMSVGRKPRTDIVSPSSAAVQLVPAGARSYSFAVPGAPERLYRLEQARLAGMYRE